MVSGIFSNELLFVRGLQQFIKHTVASPNNPLLLILINSLKSSPRLQSMYFKESEGALYKYEMFPIFSKK